MSGWQLYEAKLLARSAMHQGWHALGLIRRTRYYIPPRSVWGYVVSQAAAWKEVQGEGACRYKNAATYLKDRLLFTGLFFEYEDNEGWHCCRPAYEEDGLNYGDFSAASFEYRFVFSQASAALDPLRLTALDGALHEAEYLAMTDPVSGGRVRYRGHLFVRGLEVQRLKTLFFQPVFGGSRGYGWGETSLDGELTPCTGKFLGAFEVKEGPDGACLVETETGGYAPAPVLVEGATEELIGDVEVLTGRAWDAGAGPGRKVDSGQLCWSPGSRFVRSGKYKVGAQGVWSKNA